MSRLTLLDTNIVSELTSLSPDQVVYDWVHSQKKDNLFFTTVGEAELRQGLALMPAGRRKDGLAARTEGVLQDKFAGRILPFDRKAGRHFWATGRPATSRRPGSCAIRHHDRGDSHLIRDGRGDQRCRGFHTYGRCYH